MCTSSYPDLRGSYATSPRPTSCPPAPAPPNHRHRSRFQGINPASNIVTMAVISDLASTIVLGVVASSLPHSSEMKWSGGRGLLSPSHSYFSFPGFFLLRIFVHVTTVTRLSHQVFMDLLLLPPPPLTSCTFLPSDCGQVAGELGIPQGMSTSRSVSFQLSRYIRDIIVLRKIRISKRFAQILCRRNSYSGIFIVSVFLCNTVSSNASHFLFQ